MHDLRPLGVCSNFPLTVHWDLAGGFELKIKILTNISRNKSSQRNHWDDTAENVKEIWIHTVQRGIWISQRGYIGICHQKNDDGNVHGEIIARIKSKARGIQLLCIKTDRHLSDQLIAVKSTHLVCSSLSVLLSFS